MFGLPRGRGDDGAPRAGTAAAPRSRVGLRGVGVAFLGCALQSIKRAARGFRNLGYFETMVFLRLGGLDFSAQTSRLCATH